jgi:hypothetical protein
LLLPGRQAAAVCSHFGKKRIKTRTLLLTRAGALSILFLFDMSGGAAMRLMVFAFCAVAALSITVPAKAAEPTGGAKAASAPADAPITFEEYRNWRLAAMERRLSEIEIQLSAADLPALRKTRIEETRAYYKWLAKLPEAERDKRFRERFERIDANHDGVIDTAERAAWRERQRAYYGGRKREATHPGAD